MKDVWFIIASGPSLTAADCQLVRGKGMICAVNNALSLAPFADVLYAGDVPWWRQYWKEFKWFRGRRYSVSPVKHYGATQVPSEPGEGLGLKVVRLGPENGRNSGLQAINWAYLRGAQTIVLIAHDGQATDGKLHFHPDHPHPLGNCGSISKWPGAYERIWRDLEKQGVRLVNCSRQTAHTIPRMSLEDLIEEMA